MPVKITTSKGNARKIHKVYTANEIEKIIGFSTNRLSGRANSLFGGINDNYGWIKELEGELDQLNSVELEELRDDLDQLESDLQVLEDDLTQLETDLNTLDDDLTQLDQDLTDLDNELDGKFPIQETDIADDAVTTPKLIAEAVTALKIATDAVTANKIAADAVTANKIAADAVTANKIAANAITANHIGADVITSNHIGSDVIIANHIGAGEIIAEHIGADEITANHINVGELNALAVNTGDLTITGEINFDAVGTLTGQGDDWKIDEEGFAVYNFDGLGGFQPINAYNFLGSQDQIMASLYTSIEDLYIGTYSHNGSDVHVRSRFDLYLHANDRIYMDGEFLRLPLSDDPTGITKGSLYTRDSDGDLIYYDGTDYRRIDGVVIANP